MENHVYICLSIINEKKHSEHCLKSFHFTFEKNHLLNMSSERNYSAFIGIYKIVLRRNRPIRDLVFLACGLHDRSISLSFSGRITSFIWDFSIEEINTDEISRSDIYLIINGNNICTNPTHIGFRYFILSN